MGRQSLFFATPSQPSPASGRGLCGCGERPPLPLAGEGREGVDNKKRAGDSRRRTPSAHRRTHIHTCPDPFSEQAPLFNSSTANGTFRAA